MSHSQANPIGQFNRSGIRGDYVKRIAVLASLVALIACSENTAPPLDPVTLTLKDPPVQLVTDTYDGSGECVHPDVIRVGGGYVMTCTPYPSSNESYENPSIYLSTDGLSWQPPVGLTNPVVGHIDGTRLNSDPDLHMEGSQIVMISRAVTLDQGDRIYRTTSNDSGRTWSSPSLYFTTPALGGISPAYANGRIFYVDAGAKGCSTSSSTVRVDGKSTDLQQPGYVVWHLDVIWVPERNEYMAVYPAFAVGSTCAHSDLFLARSRDGRHWTPLSDPVLTRGQVAWASGTLYRSSLMYEGGTLRVWISGGTPTAHWHLGYAEFLVE
jgi:hypothetical protein